MTEVYTSDSGKISLPFTNVELTRAINELPSPFGQLTAEGYFPTEPLSSDFVAIDIFTDVIRALPAGERTVAKQGSEKELVFQIPSISHQDDFLASDIKNMLAVIARSKSPETAANLMNKRLQRLKNKFNLTWELMRMGGLKGVISDGKGTELYNLFTAFGITKKVVYFNLGSSTSNIQSACDQIYALISQDLSDEAMTGIEVRCDRSFFNKLVDHAKVKEYYLNQSNAATLANVVRGEDGAYRPRQIEFGGITFKEYNAVVPMWDGTSAKIISTDMGHAYPVGTLDSHVTYIAPPNDISVLDGMPANVEDAIHITTETMKHGAGVEILGQMHALPLWRRPKLLVECNAGSGTSTVARGDS